MIDDHEAGMSSYGPPIYVKTISPSRTHLVEICSLGLGLTENRVVLVAASLISDPSGRRVSQTQTTGDASQANRIAFSSTADPESVLRLYQHVQATPIHPR